MHKPKILLINPPQTYYEKSFPFNSYFPLGLLYVGTYVKNICQVKILDCLIDNVEAKKKGVATQYGSSLKHIKGVLKDFQPDIVGIASPFSSQSRNTLKIASLVKQVNPKIITVVGGPSATVESDLYLNSNKTVDICVIGEGELTFHDIVKYYSSGHIKDIQTIQGIHYRNEGKIIRNQARPLILNLDSLEIPDYSLIDSKRYLKDTLLYKNRSGISQNSISVITSRGCPYGCVFCSVHLHMGRLYRAHSPKYIIKHLKRLITTYGIRHFHFEDDNLTFDQKRFERILDEIIKQKLRIQWDTPNGVRLDTLSKPLLRKAKRSGCVFLRIAIESGSQQVINKIVHKGIRLDDAIKVASWCREIGIPLGAFYVIGFPGETPEDIQTTLSFALNLYKKFHVQPDIFVATPLIGTRLYQICRENKYMVYPTNNYYLSQATQLHGFHMIHTKEFDANILDNLIQKYERAYIPINKIIERVHVLENHPSHSVLIRSYNKIVLNLLKNIQSGFRFSLQKVISVSDACLLMCWSVLKEKSFHLKKA